MIYEILKCLMKNNLPPVYSIDIVRNTWNSVWFLPEAYLKNAGKFNFQMCISQKFREFFYICEKNPIIFPEEK